VSAECDCVATELERGPSALGEDEPREAGRNVRSLTVSCEEFRLNKVF